MDTYRLRRQDVRILCFGSPAGEVLLPVGERHGHGIGVQPRPEVGMDDRRVLRRDREREQDAAEYQQGKENSFHIHTGGKDTKIC